MQFARTVLVSCGGSEQKDSFLARSDNLSTINTLAGCRSSPSKHMTTISRDFMLVVDALKAKQIQSVHTKFLSKIGRKSINPKTTCIAAGGGYVCAGDSDGYLRLWRVNDGELVFCDQLHIGPISKVCVDSNLWLIIAASTTGSIGTWSIPQLFISPEPDQCWSFHTQKVTDFAVSKGMRIFSVSHDQTARCYDFCARCEILDLAFPSRLNCCVLSNSEAVLYCGGYDGKIYQIHISQDTGIPNVFEGHTMEVNDLLISSDDRSLYSASLDGTVRRWDTATGLSINNIKTDGRIAFGLTWVPDSSDDAKQTDFPTLKGSVNMNRQELVSAKVEDCDILSLDDELRIAIADISQHEPMLPIDTKDPDANNTDTNKTDADSERKQGILLQQLLAGKMSET